MKDIKTIQKKTTEWIYDTFYEKAKFELALRSRNTNYGMSDYYISDSTYLITVILNSRSLITSRAAQERLSHEFNEYQVRVLARQLMDCGKLTSRNRKLMPLSFMAIDIEGTRHNHFDTVTTVPHGHGAMLFHADTMCNFRTANAKHRKEDGSFEIKNPTPGILLIKFIPINKPSDLRNFIHYSLKYAIKLCSDQISWQPYNFYPPHSSNYPFWEFLQHDDQRSPQSDWSLHDGEDDLKRLWELANPTSRIRRRNRRGRNGTTPRHPTACL